MKVSVEQIIRPEIAQLHAYAVPDASGFVKLDAMENPYAWDDATQKAWLSDIARAQINRYPEPDPAKLKARIKSIFDVPEGFDIILGNGSDELIQILALTIAKPGAVIMAPEPTFVMYRMIATFSGLRFVGVPLKSDFSLDVEAMLAAIKKDSPALIYLAYPNNPTGNLFDRAAIEKILQTSSGLIVLDEAYSAFASDTFMSDLPRYDNLLVMRTLSKMGLAGLRLGFLAGAPMWLSEFNKIRLPYNINVLTQFSVEFALKHKAVFDKQTQQIQRDRQWLITELQQIPGLEVYSSEANFVLFRSPSGEATRIFTALKNARILIKNLSPQGGLLRDCLRVTVGTPQENRAFITALNSILQA